MRSSWRISAPAVLLAVAAGCQVRGQLILAESDASRSDGIGGAAGGSGAAGGGVGGGGGSGGGGDEEGGADMPSEACAPTEECNGADDDCDGMTDEDFDVTKDPANCGACGNICTFAHATPLCEAGACKIAECLPGFVDVNLSDADGCECSRSNGGIEICDDADNDCDGKVDEDFDKTTDVLHCGSCSTVCAFAHATPLCEAGACKMGACADGYLDLDKKPSDGCEYPCKPTGPEICDGKDNDCNGMADDNPSGVGAACGPPSSMVGECKQGKQMCLAGIITCAGIVSPMPESCDGKDNDCDGKTDEDFDKLADPRFCESCKGCDLPGAVAGCAAGTCTIAACKPGHVDRNGVTSDGCEVECTVDGPEVCDGKDNDCDGKTDTADPDVAVPSNFCVQAGACAGTKPTCVATSCDSVIKWRCVYAAPVEIDSCGNRKVLELNCDAVDGNCDGNTDESFGAAGSACNDGKAGACLGTGVYVCNTAGTGLTCKITAPGAAPSPEVCNAVDDDCNGMTDEGVYGETVPIAGGVWVFKYEASRPDASGTDEGSAEERACSRAGVLPWRTVSFADAKAACEAAGLRLCTESEWETGCEGPSMRTYPYGMSYDPDACNGNDYDPDCASPDEDKMLATGTPFGCPTKPAVSMCVSQDKDGNPGAFDMSGNLKEWTATAAGAGSRRVRGGAFDNVGAGLTCQFAFTALDEDSFYPNLGFRCCSDSPPP